MNILWILTDSIAGYKRIDKFSLLSIYEDLIRNKEGFFFNNAYSLFPSTAYSVLSMISGIFPKKISFDYFDYPPKKIIESIMTKTYMYYFKKSGFKLYSFICYNVGAGWLKEIFNPVIPQNAYVGGYQLNSSEINSFFIDFYTSLKDKENNIFFIHYRAGEKKVDNGLRNLINFLKKIGRWNKDIIIINSDHAYQSFFVDTLNPLHFDNIHIKSLKIPLFIRFPSKFNLKNFRIVDKRVYSVDIWETIADLLNISIPYSRDAISFRKAIEEDIDINKNRFVLGSAYLEFQPIKKDFIIFNNYKLNIYNGKTILNKIEGLKEKKVNNKFIQEKMLNFYYDELKEASKIFINQLNELYNISELNKLNVENKNIFIPIHQFPKDVVFFLIKKLRNKNKIFTSLSDLSKHNYSKIDLAILIFNRLTGYGIDKYKKLIKKNNIKVKEYFYISTNLRKINRKEGFFNFLKINIKQNKLLLLQKPKNTIIHLSCYPLYLNYHLKKYYRGI